MMVERVLRFDFLWFGLSEKVKKNREKDRQFLPCGQRTKKIQTNGSQINILPIEYWVRFTDHPHSLRYSCFASGLTLSAFYLPRTNKQTTKYHIRAFGKPKNVKYTYSLWYTHKTAPNVIRFISSRFKLDEILLQQKITHS